MSTAKVISPWNKIADGVWSRECIGEEQAASYCQNIRDGHTELTVETQFTSNIGSEEELIQRVKNAWLACHSRMPECATEISTGTEIPQIATYRTLQSDQDAAEWLQDTFRVVKGKSTEEVARFTYSRRLTTKGKRGMMFLVIDPNAIPNRRYTLIYNVSHAVSDSFSIPKLFNEMFRQMTLVSGNSPLPASEIDYTGVVDRLAVHPSHLYEANFQPTEEERKQAIADVLAQEELVRSHIPKSIALHPDPTSKTREHETHCLNLYFSEPESQKLLSDLRREKLSITFAAAAATLLAVKNIYSKGHETGALIGMTRNARRWVKTDQSCPSASSVVFLWIPFEEHWFRGSTKDTIMHLGRAIKEKLLLHLGSAHYLSMSCVSFSSLRAVNSMSGAADIVAGPCAPGFSSQGALNLIRNFDANGISIEAQDLRHTGRQINESPWVGMFSLWGRITLSLGFDSKYHTPEKMSRLLAETHQNLGCMADLGSKL